MRRLNDERGAVAVVAALSMTVMLGAVAMVVDFGALQAEKRELQNGADAAALALAEECAAGTAACTSNAEADQWLDANASDGDSRLVWLDVDKGARTISVRAGALEAATGRPSVPMQFASVFGIRRRDVKATSTAAWGYPKSIPQDSDGNPWPSLPLTIDGCEYDSATDKGKVFGRPVVIVFHGSGGGGGGKGGKGGGGGGGNGNVPSPCAANASGQDSPGNFGWLDRTDDCQADIVTIGTVGGDNGNNPPKGCESIFAGRIGEEIVFPVFRKASGNGSNATYQITGFATFHVTGYKLGGSGAWERPSGNPPCSGGNRCVSGYFTKVAVEAETGGENFGMTSVSLTKNPKADPAKDGENEDVIDDTVETVEQVVDETVDLNGGKDAKTQEGS